MKVDPVVDSVGRKLASTTIEETVDEQPIEKELANANEERE